MKRIFENQAVKLVGMLVVGVLLGGLFWKEDAPVHMHQGEQVEDTTWTCSMHPQIRQSEPGQCPICGMDLIPLSTTGSSNGTKNPMVYKMSKQAIALANVQTSQVVYHSPETSVSLSGKIGVNEQRLRVITAHYGGRIERLYVDFTGQWVKKGNKLASVYSPELITAQQELLETAKNQDTNSILYDAARKKLRLWKITDAQIDQLEKTGEIITAFDVYADVSGIVLNRKVTEGDHVGRGSALFEIADLREVWVLLDAYESDLPWIQVGSEVAFAVASLPGKTFTSTVTFIDPVINVKTRTASVRAVARNVDMELKLDMFVNAQIRSSVSEAGLSIPKSAVLWTGTRSVVYADVSTADMPSFEMREVVLGPRVGEDFMVVSGLQEGEKIVTNGVFAVDAAAQLNGNYSMMNRPVNKAVAVPEEFKHQLRSVGKAYFQLKNALVTDDPLLAQKSAQVLTAVLHAVEMMGLSQEALDVWTKLHQELMPAGEAIGGATDLDTQRTHFETVSKHMEEVVVRFPFMQEAIYVVYCPMAFNNKGAHWLSEVEGVSNPYFGQSMLRCGEVQKTLDPGHSQKDMVQRPMQGHQH